MKATVEVPPRHKMTTLEYWMMQIVSPRTYLKHREHSPFCNAVQFDLAMQVEKDAISGAEGLIGEEPTNPDPSVDIFEKFDSKKESEDED